MPCVGRCVTQCLKAGWTARWPRCNGMSDTRPSLSPSETCPPHASHVAAADAWPHRSGHLYMHHEAHVAQGVWCPEHHRCLGHSGSVPSLGQQGRSGKCLAAVQATFCRASPQQSVPAGDSLALHHPDPGERLT
eukprot:1159810-Pelagomonas_calceolata.AAC.20